MNDARATSAGSSPALVASCEQRRREPAMDEDPLHLAFGIGEQRANERPVAPRIEAHRRDRAGGRAHTVRRGPADRPVRPARSGTCCRREARDVRRARRHRKTRRRRARSGATCARPIRRPRGVTGRRSPRRRPDRCARPCATRAPRRRPAPRSHSWRGVHATGPEPCSRRRRTEAASDAGASRQRACRSTRFRIRTPAGRRSRRRRS